MIGNLYCSRFGITNDSGERSWIDVFSGDSKPFTLRISLLWKFCYLAYGDCEYNAHCLLFHTGHLWLSECTGPCHEVLDGCVSELYQPFVFAATARFFGSALPPAAPGTCSQVNTNVWHNITHKDLWWNTTHPPFLFHTPKILYDILPLPVGMSYYIDVFYCSTVNYSKFGYLFTL